MTRCTTDYYLLKKEVKKMKKLISILTVMGVVLTFGVAYAAGGGDLAKGMSSEYDSLIYDINPSAVPGYVNPENGAMTPLPKAFTAGGSAAGGLGMEADTFLSDIDPSRV